MIIQNSFKNQLKYFVNIFYTFDLLFTILLLYD